MDQPQQKPKRHLFGTDGVRGIANQDPMTSETALALGRALALFFNNGGRHHRILIGKSGVSPEVALRLSKSLGRSPESWLAMQYSHDLWQARQRVNLRDVEKVRLSAA